jgi:hypothetical protein
MMYCQNDIKSNTAGNRWFHWMAKKAYTCENVTLFSETADVRCEYYDHCMIIQNINVCMSVQIVPTADPVLPDSIATNFVM